MKQYFRKKSFYWILIFSIVFQSSLFAQDTIQQIIPNRKNSIEQEQKPYVILISADGYRYDLTDKWNAKYLKQLSSGGVSATSMQPCYPSLTFPNHYSIVTGLYPSHHGIVDNDFYDTKRKQFYASNRKKNVTDASWYGGEPLWVLAEKQKMLSASFYWVGSEAAIDGVSPTYYYHYNTAIPIDRRIEILKQWLALPDSVRPHFITFYFPEVDHAEHLYGVDSKQTEAAVHFVDSAVYKINETCKATGLPINFIFVSDHGFANLDTAMYLSMPAIDTQKFTITRGGELIHLYAKNNKYIVPTYKELKKEAKNYEVYLINKTPKKWRYRSKDDQYGRLGDIILVANPPASFYFRGYKMRGAHGFDNRLQVMQATFYAWGPAFKEHYQIPSFENINIYPLITHILGLNITTQIDGNFKVLKNILK